MGPESPGCGDQAPPTWAILAQSGLGLTDRDALQESPPHEPAWKGREACSAEDCRAHLVQGRKVGDSRL